MARNSMSAADKEVFDALVRESFLKLRQLRTQKKALKDKEDAMFAKLLDSGVQKQVFMEAYKRCEKEEGQLTLFDQSTMQVETVMREILAERVTEKEHDKPEADEPKAAAKKAAKKTAKKAEAAGKGKVKEKAADKAAKKKVDVVSPENLPQGRKSHRQQVNQPARPPRNGGFVDRTERMSVEQLNALTPANQKPS